MNTNTRKQIFLFSLAGIFFIIDRILKWYAPQSESFGFTYVGFEYFENTGIAFSIPVPHMVTLFLTPVIVVLLLTHVQPKKNCTSWLAWSLLSAGACSNFIDRVLFGFVIDYIRITTAVINIADVLIIIGILLLFFRSEHSDTATTHC